MAKLARAVGRAYARPLALPLALSALLCAPAARADWTFIPTLDLRETFTDNVGLQDSAGAHSEFIHEIVPGFRLRHKGPRLVMNSLYELHYYKMDHNAKAATNRTSRLLRADARASLLEDMLYMDANADIRQTGVSPFGPPLFDGGWASANRSEVKTYRISPYMVHSFGTRATSELRYVHDSVDAGRDSGLGNTTGDTLSLRLNSGRGFKTVGWGLAASEQRIHDKVRNDSRIQIANLNLRFRIGQTFDLTAGAGYDNYDYEAMGGANGGKAWNAGFAWTPSSRTSLQASWGHRYYGPSRMLSALHRSRRTAWNISYDDAVTTTRANFLIPSAIDTATLLDGLFLPYYPDQAERQRAVDAYIRSTGLPPSLAENINYFSNRYVLQKQLRASVAIRGARSSAVLGAFRVRRDALSVREADSILLGDSVSTINDNVIQAGVNATLNYRIKPYTTLKLVADAIDNESLTTGFKSRTHVVRLGAHHQVRQKLLASAELRHIRGNRSLQVASPYTENAVSASLSMQF